jgi:hypothetical protein
MLKGKGLPNALNLLMLNEESPRKSHLCLARRAINRTNIFSVLSQSAASRAWSGRLVGRSEESSLEP